MDKKSIVNDLYHASLISVFTFGYSVLDKKILRMAPRAFKNSIWKTQENWSLPGKLVAASEMTREHLIKQKILQHINI